MSRSHPRLHQQVYANTLDSIRAIAYMAHLPARGFRPLPRIVSLADMKEVMLPLFLTAAQLAGNMESFEEFSDDTPISVALPGGQAEGVRFLVDKLHEACEALGLPMSAKSAREMSSAFRTPSPHFTSTIGYLRRQYAEFQGRINDETHARLFLALDPTQAELYRSAAPLGTITVDKFPQTAADLEEAGKCFALERWTACVFHLMRVMEIGVQEFGQVLNVPINVQEKTWGQIQNHTKAAIAAITDHRRKERMASVDANLNNVRIAWRNNVMHPNATYTEEEAERILLATRGFMEELAEVC